MANRPFEGLTDKWVAAKEKYFSGKTQIVNSPEDFNNQLQSVLNTMKKELPKFNGDFDAFLVEIKTPESKFISFKLLKDVGKLYAKLHMQFADLVDAEKAIHRIENKASWLAVWFRFATTIGIGLAVLIVYAMAQYFGLDMPLKGSFK